MPKRKANSSLSIAVLGTGLLGTAIVQRLQSCGHRLALWNRTPEKAAALVAENTQVYTLPATAIATSDYVLWLLSDAAAIESVLADLPAGALAGKCVLQMGTISPAQSRALSQRVDALHGRYLEAPVLGSLPEARKGELQVIAAGPEELYQEVQPLLEELDFSPRWVGALGQGAAMKLALNQLIAAETAAFSLSLGLIQAEGVSVEAFMALLRDSALYAPTFDKKLAKYLQHDYSRPNFPLRHLLKDATLFAEVAAERGLDQRIPDVLRRVLEDGCQAGHADDDYSALYETLTPRPQ